MFFALLAAFATASVAQSSQPQDSRFIETVWPILSDHCLTCHGPFYQLSGLRLDSADRIERGGQGGAVVVPGNASESELFRRINRPEDDPERMPQKAGRLSERQIEAVRSWIESGADFGDFVDADSLPREPQGSRAEL